MPCMILYLAFWLTGNVDTAIINIVTKKTLMEKYFHNCTLMSL